MSDLTDRIAAILNNGFYRAADSETRTREAAEQIAALFVAETAKWRDSVADLIALRDCGAGANCIRVKCRLFHEAGGDDPLCDIGGAVARARALLAAPAPCGTCHGTGDVVVAEDESGQQKFDGNCGGVKLGPCPDCAPAVCGTCGGDKKWCGRSMCKILAWAGEPRVCDGGENEPCIHRQPCDCAVTYTRTCAKCGKVVKSAEPFSDVLCDACAGGRS